MNLPNHKSHKKKLIPNFLDFVGGHFPGIDWQGQKVPELIWISFVIDKIKVSNAVNLIVSYHEVFLRVKDSSHLNPFHLSTFELLNEEEFEKLRNLLISKGIYRDLQLSLQDFITLFPECPLNKLLNINISHEPNVKKLKIIISKLVTPTSKETILNFGTVIYSMIVNGKLSFGADSVFKNFGVINDYPNSEESKKLASFIRATINVYFSPEFYRIDNSWILYFWNKSYTYEPSRI
jgi:hypothetical protein